MKAKKTHFLGCFGAPKLPKLVQNLSERVGTRRILSGMDPKHSQPLAASERQDWQEFWQASTILQELQKNCRPAARTGLGCWAGLGWAGLGGLAPLFLCKGWLPGLGWGLGKVNLALPVFLEPLKVWNA